MYFSNKTLEKSRELTADCEREARKARVETPDRRERYSTVSDLDIKQLYAPEDISRINFAKDIGAPGGFP